MGNRSKFFQEKRKSSKRAEKCIHFDADFKFVIFLNISQVYAIDISRTSVKMSVFWSPQTLSTCMKCLAREIISLFLQSLERALVWYINEGI